MAENIDVHRKEKQICSDTYIIGEHLCMPGYEKDHPTLEIFSYDAMEPSCNRINRCGIAHLAFEVDDVEETLERLLEKGGSQIGELVHAEYEDGRKAVFVYGTDPEGNINSTDQTPSLLSAHCWDCFPHGAESWYGHGKMISYGKWFAVKRN